MFHVNMTPRTGSKQGYNYYDLLIDRNIIVNFPGSECVEISNLIELKWFIRQTEEA